MITFHKRAYSKWTGAWALGRALNPRKDEEAYDPSSHPPPPAEPPLDFWGILGILGLLALAFVLYAFKPS